MSSGERYFSASPRLALQASQVEKLDVVYMGKGSVWPIRHVDISKFRPDVVTAQDPFWRGFFAWRVARRTGAKLNIQVHTSVLNPLGRFILRRADSVRVVSEKIKKQVESLGVKAPVHVLPVYIDISKFRNIARQPHDKKTILWVGRFEDEKDPLYALEVIKKVLKQVPGAKLIMLGRGSLKASLRDKAKGLPVEFPGWRDTADYLAGADVVLCTSKHESWGASMIEALAAGVPVVAPDVGVAREAGAVVVGRSDLPRAGAEGLPSGQHGELTLQLPSAEKWARQWRQTLA